MSPRHVRLIIFGSVWHKKFTLGGFIRRIECKMKEFYTHFVESLLEGVKEKVKSLGDNGVYA